MARRSRRRIGVALVSLAMCGQTLVGATGASAQASRTWVSGVGDDVNPCSRTAPCKTFAGAISKTATGGEISVLDPGGFGAVTITKSITISGNGNASSILAAGQNGITVNGANIVVRITGVEINGHKQAGGFNGIRFLQGKSLTVDNVDIYNFSGNGILMTAPGRLMVRNTRIDNNLGSGISVTPTSGNARATVVGARMDLNGTGFHAGPGARVAIRDCSASNNTSAGLKSTNAGMVVDSCMIQANQTGIAAESASHVRVQRTVVTDNLTGLAVSGGSTMKSGGDNTVDLNATNGSFTGTYSA